MVSSSAARKSLALSLVNVHETFADSWPTLLDAGLKRVKTVTIPPPPLHPKDEETADGVCMKVARDPRMHDVRKVVASAL